MNEHAAAALVGLDRAAPPDAWPPGLARPAGEGMTDAKALLLAAGSWAVAERAAGLLADAAPEPAAPLETAAACPPGLARLFRAAWGPSPADLRKLDRGFRRTIEGQLDDAWPLLLRRVLPEMLARLAAEGAVLPPECVAGALAMPKGWRPAVGPVLGARGRWLAGLMGVAEEFPAGPPRAAPMQGKRPTIQPHGPLATLADALKDKPLPWGAMTLLAVLRDLIPEGLPPGAEYASDALAWGAAVLPADHVGDAWDRLLAAAGLGGGLGGGRLHLGRGWTTFAAVLHLRRAMAED